MSARKGERETIPRGIIEHEKKLSAALRSPHPEDTSWSLGHRANQSPQARKVMPLKPGNHSSKLPLLYVFHPDGPRAVYGPKYLAALCQCHVRFLIKLSIVIALVLKPL